MYILVILALFSYFLEFMSLNLVYQYPKCLILSLVFHIAYGSMFSSTLMIMDDILNYSIDLIWLKMRNWPNLAYFPAIVGVLLQIEITGPLDQLYV